ncbi:hypothetical protein AGLY_018301 [Aphis glycines]|uniref:ribonuclease H n=1 Tax=Aphis glycines TaxID=307491 RepID=A0A6G0SSP0_APHGL|nr:hypothetical protein AGLY_018301 [Aphis glycines]
MDTYLKLIKKETSQRTNIIKILAHTTWGFKSKLLIQLHKALIRSKLEYGAEVYLSAKTRALKTIDPMHNTCLRLAIGAFKSSPVESIYNISSEPPLWIRRIKIALNFAARLTRNNNEKLIPEHIKQIITKFELDFSNMIKNSIKQAPPWSTKIYITVELSENKKKETSPEIFKNLFHDLKSNLIGQDIYTDASKSEQGVGIAIIIDTKITTYKLQKNCSIYTAEAIAILSALKLIENDTHQYYNIFTDSLSIINSIQNTFHTNDIATTIINQVEKLKNLNKNIKFIWTPGHCKINGNELADQHAKKATLSEAPKQKYNTIIDTKNHINILTRNIWQNHWVNQKNKLREIKQNINPWPQTKTTRKTEIIITRLRIGHTLLTHGHLMNNQTPTECPSCGTTLTVKHLLTECRSNEEERKKHNIPSNLYEIIGPDSLPETILSFLKALNLEKKHTIINTYI